MIKLGEVIGGESFLCDLPSSEDLSSSLSLRIGMGVFEEFGAAPEAPD